VNFDKIYESKDVGGGISCIFVFLSAFSLIFPTFFENLIKGFNFIIENQKMSEITIPKNPNINIAYIGIVPFPDRRVVIIRTSSAIIPEINGTKY